MYINKKHRTSSHFVRLRAVSKLFLYTLYNIALPIYRIYIYILGIYLYLPSVELGKYKYIPSI